MEHLPEWHSELSRDGLAPQTHTHTCSITQGQNWRLVQHHHLLQAHLHQPLQQESIHQMFKNGRRVFFCDALNFTKEHGLLQQSPHRKYEALRDVLATKYGVNLKRKVGFVTHQY